MMALLNSDAVNLNLPSPLDVYRSNISAQDKKRKSENCCYQNKHRIQVDAAHKILIKMYITIILISYNI